MDQTRLQKQIEFIIEIDKLKHIVRRSRLIGSTRYENDAEHTWHITIMAILLSEHANGSSLDLIKVVKMLLVHDLVEIDAGDTFAYDTAGHADKRAKEELAAERIFGLLPQDQADEFTALWNEFEERQTPESRYAVAMDRLQPMLLNYSNKGAAWKENGIHSERVIAYNQQIENGSEELWRFARQLLADAEKNGYFHVDVIE